MPDTYLNRVKMTMNGAPNTGTATLNAASTGYVAFASGDGGKTYSILWEDTGNAWEIGTGCTYTHSGTTLTRGTRIASSTGSALNLTSAATATVIIEAGAAQSWDAVADVFGHETLSVTGAVTATIGVRHVCSGTSANYTVTLPAASGNAGKMIGFQMDSGLTKVVTLDANSTEKIDGLETLPMLANDTAVLYCNGSNWFTVAGRLGGTITRIENNGTTTQTINNASTKISAALTTVISDKLSEWDATNKKYTPKRKGRYAITLAAQNSTVSSQLAIQLYKNGSINAQGYAGAASTYQQAYTTFIAEANGTTDYFESYCFSSASVTTNAYTTAIIFQATYLGISE